MNILQTKNNIRTGTSTEFVATDGNEPYTFSVEPDGAGGSIDSLLGTYTAPSSLPEDGSTVDTIKVTDNLGDILTTTINVLRIEEFVALIVKNELSLDSDQIIIQNQKFIIPNDKRVYCSLKLVSGKPISNNKKSKSDAVGMFDESYVVMRDMLEINLMSYGERAMDSRYDILMAIASTFSIQVQEVNSFTISKTPLNVTNISGIEGSKIPFAFNISLSIQYGIKKIKYIHYYDKFSLPILQYIEP